MGNKHPKQIQLNSIAAIAALLILGGLTGALAVVGCNAVTRSQNDGSSGRSMSNEPNKTSLLKVDEDVTRAIRSRIEFGMELGDVADVVYEIGHSPKGIITNCTTIEAIKTCEFPEYGIVAIFRNGKLNNATPNTWSTGAN